MRETKIHKLPKIYYEYLIVFPFPVETDVVVLNIVEI